MIKKQTKSLSRIVMAVFLIVFGLTSIAYAIPKATTEFYVADYANILKQDTKDFITGVNLKYEKQSE
ncbi:MAG TPA: hypothetical protein GX707_08845 [Epulopiscium sp.]|nr:hypothetical protein [Candidatus Epulonipiscium sp.]